MHPETEALARRAMDDFNRAGSDGRFTVDDSMREIWTEDALIVPMRAAVDGTTYRGPTALDQFSRDNAEAWERLHVDVSQIRELDDGSALIYVDLTAVARGTGIETGGPLFMRMTMRDGRIASMRTFLSEEDALREAS